MLNLDCSCLDLQAVTFVFSGILQQTSPSHVPTPSHTINPCPIPAEYIHSLLDFSWFFFNFSIFSLIFPHYSSFPPKCYQLIFFLWHHVDYTRSGTQMHGCVAREQEYGTSNIRLYCVNFWIYIQVFCYHLPEV